MYLFDNLFGEKAPSLLQDYEVPIYFAEDFFKVLEDGTGLQLIFELMNLSQFIDPAFDGF